MPAHRIPSHRTGSAPSQGTFCRPCWVVSLQVFAHKRGRGGMARQMSVIRTLHESWSFWCRSSMWRATPTRASRTAWPPLAPMHCDIARRVPRYLGRTQPDHAQAFMVGHIWYSVIFTQWWCTLPSRALWQPSGDCQS